MKILKNTGCFKMLKPKGINATETPRPASNKRTRHGKQRKVTLKLNVVPKKKKKTGYLPKAPEKALRNPFRQTDHLNKKIKIKTK